MSKQILAREGEYGWVFLMDTTYTPASIVQAVIHFTGPDGAVQNKTCDYVSLSDGDYGWTVTADFFTRGRWQASLEIELTTGGVRKTQFPVYFRIGADNE